jgi:Cu(I)/Ag(I) efflux system membrane fusion protein
MVPLPHPEIPALKWPAMTMEFKLPPEGKSGRPKAGQRISIEFRMVEGEVPQITTIKPLTSPAQPGVKP